jgi:hypothetical protein
VFQNVTLIDKKCNPNQQKECQNRTQNNTRIIERIPCEQKDEHRVKMKRPAHASWHQMGAIKNTIPKNANEKT